MKAALVLCLALALCSAVRTPIPYEVYVKNGGLPLPVHLQTGKWYNPEQTEFIVGGSAASSGEVPHIVSLQTSSHFCGGSVVNARTVLTAAHCVDGQSASRLKIRVGSLQHNSGGSLISVSKIVSHSGYNPSTIDYDIALLHTSTDIPINGNTIKAVSLPSSEPSSGTSVLVAGWGTTSQGAGTLPTNLQKVNVNVVARSSCQSSYGSSSITNRMICAGVNGGGRDSCQGDSGGPLTVNGVQYGVVSWGRGCAQAGYPGVYTNVASLLSWINANKA